MNTHIHAKEYTNTWNANIEDDEYRCEKVVEIHCAIHTNSMYIGNNRLEYIHTAKQETPNKTILAHNTTFATNHTQKSNQKNIKTTAHTQKHARKVESGWG